MQKTLFNSLLAGATVLFLLSGCAEDSKDTSSTTDVKASTAKSQDAKMVASESDQSGSLMDQPVNFSTPEEVEKTLQHIRENEGDLEYKKLKGAMSYILTYDLGLRHNKDKLHAKLNGKTPNEIIASMKR
jgi:hypothetical protein